jgi:transposase InsO family protein
MTDRLQQSSEALFRFVTVSEILARIATGEPRADVVGAVAARRHTSFDGAPRRVSERSLYRWLAAFSVSGFAGLEPKQRTRVPSALSKELIEFLIAEQTGDDPASIPELIRRAKEYGVVKPNEAVHRVTVYRMCKRLHLHVGRIRRAKDRDSRRFAYPHRMDMVLCDGKHFRAGAQRAKRVALFFLDDASRYALHTVVGTSETQELFQRGLYECIVKHGYMGAVYLDRGPGFIAEDTAAVFVNLNIPLIHGAAGYKEGRGKVERFNRTAKADALRSLAGRPDVDPSCGALELRLRHYTEQVYAHRAHESLDGATPWQRFYGDAKALRFPDSVEVLGRMFELWTERRVSTDHVVSIDSVAYEMPRGYATRKVLLRRRLLDGGIGFLHDGRLIDLHPIDLAANARAHRARGSSPDEPPRSVPKKSAADIAFQRDFGPVVGDDGGALPLLPHHD